MTIVSPVRPTFESKIAWGFVHDVTGAPTGCQNAALVGAAKGTSSVSAAAGGDAHGAGVMRFPPKLL